MGKRHNKNRKKKLKNSSSEKKPCTFEQDDTKGRHTELKNSSKHEYVNESEYSLCKDLFNHNLDNDYDDPEFDKSKEVLNFYEFHKKEKTKDHVSMYNSSDQFHQVGTYAKQPITQATVQQPAHTGTRAKMLIISEKKTLIPKDHTHINNPEAITSQQFNTLHKTSYSKETEIKNMTNEQEFKNSHVTTKFTTRHTDEITSSFNCKSIKGNPNNDVSNMAGAKPKHIWRAISDPSVKEYENYSYSDYIYESDDNESVKEYEKYSYRYSDYDCIYESDDNEQNLHKNKITSKENFLSSVNEYEHSKNTFSSVYHKWIFERLNTLDKLQSLYKEVRDGRIKYNEAQAQLKECSFKTRSAKVITDSMLVGFLASAMTFVTDAASGVASFAQAYNTDLYQSKFQEIMDHDAEITKELYEIRSQCVAEYQGIEEVMRKFHSDTFSSTVSKISDTLEMGAYWKSMKMAYMNDDMSALMDIVGNFFNNACRSETLGKVCESVETYVSNNPAALEGCKSTGTALYESVNAWSPLYTRKSIRGHLDNAVTRYMMVKDKEEAERLKNEYSEYYSESKLESQIKDAIDSLESEMREVRNTYDNLFKNENRKDYDYENRFEDFSD